jgi:predicted Rossmann fold flavoprotein
VRNFIAYDLCIVGGGSAGLIAAVSAGQSQKTCIIERMDRVGKKLLATGDGRCNLTNRDMTVNRYHGRNPDFARPAMERFGLGETLAFFESIGLVWKQDSEGRIFPFTNQASTVLDLLRHETGRLKVDEICNTEIHQIEKSEGRFVLRAKGKQTFACRKTILASGGRAAPGLGSNGSGYSLARQLGHTVAEPFPALVQICLRASFLKKLKGIKTVAKASLLDANRIVATASGEIGFTDYGLSGIPVLNLSRHVHPFLRSGQKLFLELDLYPEKTDQELLRFLEERFRLLHYKKVAEALVGMLNKRLASVLLSLTGINENLDAELVGGADIRRFAGLLKSWKTEVIGTKSWSEAQATAGGVNTDEVDPQTLESKIVPGLYFAGEILDIDGDCGGYNLQWAWSSGHAAGIHASGA